MAKQSEEGNPLLDAAREAVRIQAAHRGQKEARLLNLLSGGSSFSPSEEAAIAERMRNSGRSRAEAIEELLDFGFL
jgi:hypothetical protein